MRKNIVFIAFLIFFLSFTFNVFAQRGTAREETVNIRLASTLPRNSDWGRALDRLAADWQRGTNNALRVVVSHDGREGSEARMLSSLTSNDIQVAVFSSAGISEICPAVLNLSVPFMINTEAELDLVLREVLPVIERRVRNEFVVLTWSRGGWVYLYSKDAVFTPDDLRRQRLATSPELREINTVFRTMGFNLVESDMQSLGPRLANNMVNSIYIIPSILAPLGLHRSIGHMLDMPIAPVMGALVMNRVTWNRLSSAHQQEILRLARAMGSGFDTSAARTETNAIAAMRRDGLRINQPTQAHRNLWQTELQNVLPSIIGSIFDRDIYNQISAILERSRSGR